MGLQGLFWRAYFEEKHESLKSGFYDLRHKIDWTLFKQPLEKALSRLEKDPKVGGRPPFDPFVMFRILVLQQFHQISDEGMEFQLYDRLSFCQFAGLTHADRIPDAKTIWLFRHQLAEAGMMKMLFETFESHLRDLGLMARGGQLVDASVQEVRKPRSTKEEAYETAAAKAQHDKDATFTKKHNQTFYGYKNHVNIDKRYKFIRVYEATTAAPHDSKLFDETFDERNTGSAYYADSAYRGGWCDEEIGKRILRDKRQFRAWRNKPLTGHQNRANKARSRVRAHVEHVFTSNKNWGSDSRFAALA